jgi:hypothetical protein
MKNAMLLLMLLAGCSGCSGDSGYTYGEAVQACEDNGAVLPTIGDATRLAAEDSWVRVPTEALTTGGPGPGSGGRPPTACCVVYRVAAGTMDCIPCDSVVPGLLCTDRAVVAY